MRTNTKVVRFSFSLATLLGVMAGCSHGLLIVLAVVVDTWHDPILTLIAMLFISPFLLPTLVTATVLWQGMIESISHGTIRR